MRIKTGLLLFLVSIALCQYEVIPISNRLSETTRERLWPVYKSGAIHINEHEIIIPDESSLFIQNRLAPYDYTNINLKRHKRESFTVYKVTASKTMFAYGVLGDDGRYYLFERKRETGEIQGPVLRHGATLDRMFLCENNKLIVTGAHRPELMQYLEKYRGDSLEEKRRNSKAKFDGLYINHKAYTLSVYDKSMTEIDSGNVLDRTGDNALAFQSLFLTHAVDINKDEELYLIDNDQGYVVEKYTGLTRFASSFEIKNPRFKKLSDVMTLEDLKELRSIDRAYSVAYALYQKDNYLLTCFFQAPIRRDTTRPPYYYDVSTESGELLYSGQLEYPFLCEDDGEKLFLYVKQEGGWFED
ncbi:MAG: hypothetical protein HOF96_14370, partial [Candidatus Marinimicrobia bacterium]|nr:hypothetical protein [Candidatus Neomarinimicrobiota bacterium]MBT4992247.1 hypothetical protein [Candidatus Neomarinimicrobiota bacterium]MBT5467965.1 hypothetical protein [Candidatus Neomarinimicrobiota bacterium]MBT6758072.1 hypothetical protein [Candidatus Neomarinimicrobiota bacterium]